MVRFEPVLDKDGGVVLYDIFINGVWHGSRRTQAYCISYVIQEAPTWQPPQNI